MHFRSIAFRVVTLFLIAAVSPQQAPVRASSPESKTPYGEPTICREGCEFSDLKAAIRAAKPGAMISIAPGTYGTCGVIDKPLRLIGIKDASGKRAHLAGALCEGNAALVLKASGVTIEGLEISNITSPDKNGACIRVDTGAGDIIIRDLYCHDSEDGVLGGPKEGSVTIEDSLFERNGTGGRAHGIYITSADSFILRHSKIISTKGEGHTLKSGARRTVIEDSVLASLDGQNSRAIDAYAGGVLEVRRSVIQQGPNSENNEAIGIALEPQRINPEPHSTLIEDNWIIFDDLQRCCRWLFQANQSGPITMRRNRVVGMTVLFGESNVTPLADNNFFYRDREEAGLPKYDGTLASLPKPGS